RCHVFTGERLEFASGIAWCSGPSIGSGTERRCRRPLVIYPSHTRPLICQKPFGGTLLLGLPFTESPWITAVGRRFCSRPGPHGSCRPPPLPRKSDRPGRPIAANISEKRSE
ncbi:unnamed protein product, partial [Musa textilis]